MQCLSTEGQTRPEIQFIFKTTCVFHQTFQILEHVQLISYRIHCLRWNSLSAMLDTLLVCVYDLNTSKEEQRLMLSSTASIHLKMKLGFIHPHPTLRYQLLPHDVTVACSFFHFLFSTFPPFKLLTPFPIGNRWETFAVGYCQMEQILITTSASSVYSLQASPPPLAPLCHLMCSTLVSDADVSFCYASFCWLQDIYHPQHRMAKTDIICFVGLFRVICCIAAGAG